MGLTRFCLFEGGRRFVLPAKLAWRFGSVGAAGIHRVIRKLKFVMRANNAVTVLAKRALV